MHECLEGVRMCDVRPGPLEGSECFMLGSECLVSAFDGGPGPLEGSEYFTLKPGPSRGQNI